jgi:hypothetical protein
LTALVQAEIVCAWTLESSPRAAAAMAAMRVPFFLVLMLCFLSAAAKAAMRYPFLLVNPLSLGIQVA